MKVHKKVEGSDPIILTEFQAKDILSAINEGDLTDFYYGFGIRYLVDEMRIRGYTVED